MTELEELEVLIAYYEWFKRRHERPQKIFSYNGIPYMTHYVTATAGYHPAGFYLLPARFDHGYYSDCEYSMDDAIRITKSSPNWSSFIHSNSRIQAVIRRAITARRKAL